jgi:hypothetical protein
MLLLNRLSVYNFVAIYFFKSQMTIKTNEFQIQNKLIKIAFETSLIILILLIGFIILIY